MAKPNVNAIFAKTFSRMRAISTFLFAAILIAIPLQSSAYQVGGSQSGLSLTYPSGLTITASGGSGLNYPGPSSMSARNYNHGAGTYVMADGTDITSSVNSQNGLNWEVSGTGCTLPGANATSTGCSKGTINIAFSDPVKNPVLFVNDIGGAFDAGCILGISSQLNTSYTLAGGGSSSSITKTSTATGNGAAILSGTIIKAPAIPVDSYQGNHANGSFALTGLVTGINLSVTVDIKRTGTGACSYDAATTLMSLVETVTMTISLPEDFGDAPISYDAVSAGNAASNVVGDLKLGASVSEDLAHTVNTNSAAISSATTPTSPDVAKWGITASVDTFDDAISAASLVSGTQKLATGIMLNNGYSLTIPISGAGTGSGALKAGNLCGYIDLNADGKYTTTSPNESACATYSANATSATITWLRTQWPAGAVAANAVGLRLRTAYGSAATLSANSLLPSGETEDYLIDLLPEVPPAGVNLTGTKGQDVNQTFTPATTQGAFVAANTCIIDGASCVTSKYVAGEGTYSVNTTTGVITFNPDATFTGTGTGVTYRITDSASQSSTATIIPTVVPAPRAVSDSASAVAGTTQTINVLLNDAPGSISYPLDATTVKLCGSADTAPNCTQTSVIVAGKGKFTVNSDGTIKFEPCTAANTPAGLSCTGAYAGTVPSQAYSVQDSLAQIASSTIAVTVNPGAPVSASDTPAAGGQDKDQILNVLNNDTAGLGGALDPASVRLCGISPVQVAPNCNKTNLDVPGQGVYSVNSDGTITFNPYPSFTGAASAVTYQVAGIDGQTSSASLTTSVTPGPTVVSDTQSGKQNTAIVFDLTANDSANSATSLVKSTIRLCDPTTTPPQQPNNCTVTPGTTITVSGIGTYSVNASGVLTFTPTSTYSGTAPALPYQVSDALGATSSGTFTATIVAPPTVAPDFPSGAWDTDQMIAVLGNDNVGTGGSAAGTTLTPSSVKLCAVADTAPNCTQSTLTTVDGVYTVNANGTITFNPAPNFTGTSTHPVTYSVTDSLNQKSSTTITPSVATPGAPVASPDTLTKPQNQTATINPLLNDQTGTPTNTNLSFAATSVKICATSTSGDCTSTSQVVIAGQGIYSVNTTTGDLTFTPCSAANTPAGASCTAAFSGTATPVKYTVADNSGQTTSSTFTPTFVALPALTADTSTATWDTNVTISVLGNDAVGNGGSTSGTTLNPSSVKLCGSSDTAPNCTQTTVTTVDGTYTINSGGTITFDPLPSFSGTSTHPVSYSVTDSLNQKSSTTFTATVTPPAAPVANTETKQVSPTATTPFTAIVGSGGLATGSGLTAAHTFLCAVGQSAPNCSATTVSTVDGTWLLSQLTGIVYYTPNPGVTAGTKAPITYQVTDATGQTATATLTPEIPVPPTVRPDQSTGAPGVAQLIAPLGNDVAGNINVAIDSASVKLCAGNTVSPNCVSTSVAIAGVGSYTVGSHGLVLFTPDPVFSGTAPAINYQVSDSFGQSASSTITVIVNPPPAPIAIRDTGSAAYGQAVNFKPWMNDLAGELPAGATGTLPVIVPTSIKLCGATETAPTCSSSTVTTADGTYVLTASTGDVVFTPRSGFSGLATAPLTYQINNNWTVGGTRTSTAVLLPTISAPADPTAKNDLASTKPTISVAVMPAANDQAGAAQLVSTSLRLCQQLEVAPDCTQTSITTAQGTYVVDQNSGEVVFTPANGFSGVASVAYVIADTNGHYANANIIVTVAESAVVSPKKAKSKQASSLAKTGNSISLLVVIVGISLLLLGMLLLRSRKHH